MKPKLARKAHTAAACVEARGCSFFGCWSGSVATEDVALLLTDFEGTTADTSGRTVQVSHKAIEVLRRQPDGTWQLILGHPNGRK